MSVVFNVPYGAPGYTGGVDYEIQGYATRAFAAGARVTLVAPYTVEDVITVNTSTVVTASNAVCMAVSRDGKLAVMGFAATPFFRVAYSTDGWDTFTVSTAVGNTAQRYLCAVVDKVGGGYWALFAGSGTLRVYSVSSSGVIDSAETDIESIPNPISSLSAYEDDTEDAKFTMGEGSGLSCIEFNRRTCSFSYYYELTSALNPASGGFINKTTFVAWADHKTIISDTFTYPEFKTDLLGFYSGYTPANAITFQVTRGKSWGGLPFLCATGYARAASTSSTAGGVAPMGITTAALPGGKIVGTRGNGLYRTSTTAGTIGLAAAGNGNIYAAGYTTTVYPMIWYGGQCVWCGTTHLSGTRAITALAQVSGNTRGARFLCSENTNNYRLHTVDFEAPYPDLISCDKDSGLICGSVGYVKSQTSAGNHATVRIAVDENISLGIFP